MSGRGEGKERSLEESKRVHGEEFGGWEMHVYDVKRIGTYILWSEEGIGARKFR